VVLLEDASQLIVDLCNGQFPKSKEAAAKRITCEVVKRAMISPVDQLPLKSMTEQQMGGPYMGQRSETYANPTGDLYLTTSEKKQLGIGRQRFGAIRPAIHTVQGGDVDGW
jgi:hypothetical protein